MSGSRVALAALLASTAVGTARVDIEGRGAGRDKVVEKEEEPTDEEDEQEQADSVYRGGMWLEGVSSSSNRHASYPPKVERTDDISASARIPDIVSGVVMNYSFIQVGFCLVFSQVL